MHYLLQAKLVHNIPQNRTFPSLRYICDVRDAYTVGAMLHQTRPPHRSATGQTLSYSRASPKLGGGGVLDVRPEYVAKDREREREREREGEVQSDE
jgi:hypothetical protein